MQCLAGEEILQDFYWDGMTGKFYYWQHHGDFLQMYVLLLKPFFETPAKKRKKGEEKKVCCVVRYLTRHSHVYGNKQIRNKVQPSELKSTTGFAYFFKWMQRKGALRKNMRAATFSQETSNLAGVNLELHPIIVGRDPLCFSVTKTHRVILTAFPSSSYYPQKVANS